MSRTKRVFLVTLQILGAALALEAVGCSDSNEPSNTGAGATGGTGGSSTGTGATGGATTGTGGTTSGSTTGTGGAGGTTGGSSGAGGAGGGGTFSPLCSGLTTMAGGEPTKGGVCAPADSQLCYKTCGPQSIGFKSETCTGGLYVEQSGCDFPANADYACYKIPMPVSATCPAAVPQASQACDVAECTPCNVGGLYADSGGAQKEGYCVCPKAGSAGTRKWTCASSTAWPCPAGKGC